MTTTDPALVPGAEADVPTAPTGAPRSVVLLGSTGSIGTQAIDVLSRHPGRFRVTGISAGGADPRALGRQAVALGAQTVAVADPDASTPARDTTPPATVGKVLLGGA